MEIHSQLIVDRMLELDNNRDSACDLACQHIDCSKTLDPGMDLKNLEKEQGDKDKAPSTPIISGKTSEVMEYLTGWPKVLALDLPAQVSS